MIQLDNCDFEAKATFECGQCFRWDAADDGYTGIADGKICKIHGSTIICPDCDNEFWSDYFCLGYDYAGLKKNLLSADPKLKDCIEYGGGIRILKQPLWETVVSFIISANNNIPRIRKIISTLCQSFGDKITYEGITYYSFPSPERLAALDVSDLAHLRAGYRDKYLLDAAEKFATGEVSGEVLRSLPTSDAKKLLLKIKGVGGKVADCILLFALGRYEVFPQDVWIKRIMNQIYGVSEKDTLSFVESTYGALGGFAQQYLYYYYRDHSQTKENN